MQGVIEDPNADLTQYSKISTCSASINGKTCRCDVCDHGQGVSLNCGGGLIQTCIEPTADMDSSVSLVRFTKGQHWEQNQFVSLNSASSAATSTIAATTTLAPPPRLHDHFTPLTYPVGGLEVGPVLDQQRQTR